MIRNDIPSQPINTNQNIDEKKPPEVKLYADLESSLEEFLKQDRMIKEAKEKSKK